MVMTVIDSTDTAAILADAGVTLDAPADDKSQDKLAKSEPAAKHEPEDEPEDDNGLSEEERKSLTEKMQKAVGKRHRMMREAEEFAAAQYSERKLAEQRAEALERELAELKGKADPQAKLEAPAKPKREDYQSESDYLDASIDWGVQEGLRKKAEQEAREAQERTQAQMVEAAKERIAKARDLVPDFDDVVGSIDHEVPKAIAGYMQKSELFAELGYHLAKNPELLVSLAKLQPDEQLVKIGKIEATLSPFGSKSAHDDDKSSNTKQSNGQAKPAPSDDTGTAPSKARSTAPVITPLNGTGTAHEKEPKDFNVREAISDYAKRNQLNFNLRKRH